MLTDLRWEKEQELMRSVFPEFEPFLDARNFGFRGWLKGKNSQTLYRVIVEGSRDSYPQIPPRVKIEPPVGPNWANYPERVLCVAQTWLPARSTFANRLLVVIRYLDEVDR
jgi:hypothetical protein